MSLSLYDRIGKNFSLRLTLWYVGVFTLAYVLIFAIAYYILSSSLKKEDFGLLASKFKEYERVYKEEGLSGLSSLIDAQRNSEIPMPFFVRVAKKDNSTLLLSLPDKWSGIDLNQIGDIFIEEKEQKVRVASKNHETIFEIITFPLEDGNFIQIGKEIDYREKTLARLWNVFVSVMIPAILIGIIGGYLLTFRALRPIRHLTRTVRTIIDTGEITSRVPEGKAGDEINNLVMLFNTMLERIENLINVIKESLDNVAHDLRTPMTRLRAIAETAFQSGENLEIYREALSDCLEESERIVRMLNTIMDISEARAKTLKLNIKQIGLSSLIEEVVELYQYIAEEKGITITKTLTGDTYVSVDPDRIRQVVGNLLDNGIKYTPPGGKININAFQKDDQVLITIKDTGIGIRKEDIPKIWDRLYRADESRSQKGLGLGLYIVRSLVELHGGHIEVSSEFGKGSKFIIYLPKNA